MDKGDYRVAVDIGGTFTDGIAEEYSSGRIWVEKSLTTPEDPGLGVSKVVQQLLAQIVGRETDAPSKRVEEIVHGTTLVTNALIERKGARTGLVVTRGTKDVLDIAREVRYDLYDLGLERPEPVVPGKLRFEVDERLEASGGVLVPLEPAALDDLAGAIDGANLEAIAVCLLHAYANDEHERRVETFLEDRFPGVSVSLSSRVASEIREFERMSTVAANAYVRPLMERYLDVLEDRLAGLGLDAPIRIMVSSGGFTSTKAAAEVPILLLESGPAAGVLSAINAGIEAGTHDLLAFDMGGTTAKAAVVMNGQPALTHNFEAARVRRFKRGSGLPILIPSIDLIEIGTGGGSIAHVSQLGTLNVGPRSAGAVPGPACYGRGGEEPTVTDADLALGFLDADSFLGGEMGLRSDLAEEALGKLAESIGLTLPEAAWGVCDVANENMAAAVRVHVAEKGLDPRQLTMVATGGAGPVHVVEVARKLHIGRVLCPIAPGAGSCLGLLAAPARVDRSWSKPNLLDEVDWDEVTEVLGALREEAAYELRSAGAEEGSVQWTIQLEMRYAGQGHTVAVALPHEDLGTESAGHVRGAFEDRYRQLYGATVPGALPQVVAWRLTGRSEVGSRRFSWADGRAETRGLGPKSSRPVFLPLRKDFDDIPVYDRYSLPPGTAVDGPVVIEERESTLVVPLPVRVRILPDLSVLVELEERE
jgi:N-methylhydantoinase A